MKVVSEGFREDKFVTEIDLIASNTNKKIVLWGSCKRNVEELSIENLCAHIALYHAEHADPSLFNDFVHELVLFSTERATNQIATWDAWLNLDTGAIHSAVSKILKKPSLKEFPATFQFPQSAFAVKYLCIEDIVE